MTSSKKPSNSSAKNENLYAIAETSGKQVWFEVDKYYDIDRLNAKEKDKITIDKILLIKDNDKVSIGKPYIKNAKIELEVVSHKRDKKIIGEGTHRETQGMYIALRDARGPPRWKRRQAKFERGRHSHTVTD